jgi:hypothetical protein
MRTQPFVAKTTLSTLSKKDSRQRVEEFIESNSSVNCKKLKGRKVQLSKYIEATVQRKDATSRLRTFFVAIEIIKKSHIVTCRTHNKNKEYELVGFDKAQTEVRVHVREETTNSNKELYLISSFQP